MRWSVEELIKSLKAASGKGMRLKYRIRYFFRTLSQQLNILFVWIFKGYCHVSIYNLDSYLSEVIVQRLKLFKKINIYSAPCNFDTWEEWEAILDRLINGFDSWKTESIYTEAKSNGLDSAEAMKKQNEYNEETLRLFTEYFGHLWE